MSFEEVSGDSSLPKHVRDIYEELYSSAWEYYAHEATRRDHSSREETARRIAWAAVGEMYSKNELTGEWCKLG